jgi:hypothetical protein
MKWPALLSLAAAAIVVAVVGWITLDHPDAVYAFYDAKIRASMFSGFLGLGGFLLSLKTFIIVKMKEGLYDHARYRELVVERRQLTPELTFFGPLRRLGTLLFYAIVASLGTAVLQLTLGLHAQWWTAACCLAAGAFTVTLLLFSLLQIKRNLDEWFDYLEEDARKKAATPLTKADAKST